MEMDTELNDFDEKQNDENSNSSSDSSEKVGCFCAMMLTNYRVLSAVAFFAPAI